MNVDKLTEFVSKGLSTFDIEADTAEKILEMVVDTVVIIDFTEDALNIAKQAGEELEKLLQRDDIPQDILRTALAEHSQNISSFKDRILAANQ